MRIFFWAWLIGAAIGLLLTPAHASDREREARLVEEIEANIFDGEVIQLDTGGTTFAAVEMAPDQDARGAVILLHGRGFHADWPENIGPLRVALTESGWHTLSLQLPVLEKSAKYFDYLPILPDAIPRIDAALSHLKNQGINKVVLLAHSCGAHMAMLWLEQSNGNGIDAFIGIGMGATDYQQPMRHPFPFASLSIPVLDLYGERDYPAVHRLAPERLALMTKAANPYSQQIVAPGADHYFKGSTDVLGKHVKAWLDTLP